MFKLGSNPLCSTTKNPWKHAVFEGFIFLFHPLFHPFSFKDYHLID